MVAIIFDIRWIRMSIGTSLARAGYAVGTERQLLLVPTPAPLLCARCNGQGIASTTANGIGVCLLHDNDMSISLSLLLEYCRHWQIAADVILVFTILDDMLWNVPNDMLCKIINFLFLLAFWAVENFSRIFFTLESLSIYVSLSQFLLFTLFCFDNPSFRFLSSFA